MVQFSLSLSRQSQNTSEHFGIHLLCWGKKQLKKDQKWRPLSCVIQKVTYHVCPLCDQSFCLFHELPPPPSHSLKSSYFLFCQPSNKQNQEVKKNEEKRPRKGETEDPI